MPAVSRLAEFFKGQAILLEYLACMLCGFILSNAFLLGQLAPFGVAFTAAGKKNELRPPVPVRCWDTFFHFIRRIIPDILRR